MSSTVCALEHKGDIKLDNNSFNHNDKNGEIFAQNALIAFLAFTYFFLCFLLAICITNRPLKLMFILLTLALLAVFIAFTVKVSQEACNNPIVVAYALSQYITKVVRTNPLLNPDDVFPGHRDFEAEFESIQKEVLTLAEQEDAWPLTKTTFGDANSGIGNDVRVDPETGKEIGWRLFMVSVGEKFSPRAEELLPTLTKLVKKHNDKMVSCALSMLPPHVAIPPHVGYAKSVIRYMLPVELPSQTDACFLCLNGNSEQWQLGKSFCFDDCFIHSVHNDSSQRRIVVYCDILREVHQKPLLTKMTKWVFKHCIQNTEPVKKELQRTEYLVSSPQ